VRAHHQSRNAEPVASMPAMTAEGPSGRPARIRVEGLFGLFDHDIPLQLERRVTIIHGPNGVGKTTVLAMVYNLFNQNFAAIASVSFRGLEIQFTDENVVRVTRTEAPVVQRGLGMRDTDTGHASEPILEDEQVVLRITLGRAGRQPDEAYEWRRHQGSERPPEMNRMMLERSIVRTLGLTRTSRGGWLNRDTGEEMTTTTVLQRFGDSLPDWRDAARPVLPKLLEDFLQAVPVHFVEAQRLIAVSDRPSGAWRGHMEMGAEEPAATVMRYSAALVARIRNALTASTSESQKLDGTFASRFLARRRIPQRLTRDRIYKRYVEQGKKRRQLMEAGLLASADEIKLPDRDLKSEERKILWFYLDDVEKKLAVFDEFSNKIKVLRNIINSSFLYKQLRIDRDRGFVLTADNGSDVRPDQLSSGEQHELVLAYQLLFEVKRNSLILIDEPELSLHISWQHKFLGDLKEISEVSALDFLIATHAPGIIHNDWSLAVPLTKGIGHDA
jgi:predicted ATPase